MLLIGSHALKHNLDHLVDVPNDFDFICDEEECFDYIRDNRLAIKRVDQYKCVAKSRSGVHYEFSFPVDGTAYKILKEIAYNGNISETMFHAAHKIDVPTSEFLHALKLCHRYKDHVHFLKTMKTIRMLRSQSIGVLYDERFAEVEKKFTTKPFSLNKKADEFFRESDGFYVVQHDDIHRGIVGDGNTPAYELIVSGEVQCDMNRFFSLSREDQLKCAIEECFVLAIERAVLPKYGVDIPALSSLLVDTGLLFRSYLTSVQKVCTRVTSGRFREFCWENYIDILAGFDLDYYRNFIKAVKAGNVRPFKNA